jgi:hypothetical protein
MDPEREFFETNDLFVIDQGRATTDVVDLGFLDARQFYKLFLDTSRAQCRLFLYAFFVIKSPCPPELFVSLFLLMAIALPRFDAKSCKRVRKRDLRTHRKENSQPGRCQSHANCSARTPAGLAGETPTYECSRALPGHIRHKTQT